MIKLKHHQYEKICNIYFYRFRKRLISYIMEKKNSRDESCKIADSAINKSLEYNITAENDIFYIARIILTEGFNFEDLDKNKYIKAILKNKRIAGDQKIYRIHSHKIEKFLESERHAE